MSATTIARVETILLRLPLARPIVGPFGTLTARPNLIARVELEGGAIGIGEIWGNFPPWGPQERAEIVRHVLAPLLAGEMLDDPLRLYRAMHARARLLANQWGAPGPVHQAIAGVDLALWDALARERGVPLCDLARGAPCPRAVEVSASGLGATDSGREVEAARARGFTRFKCRTLRGPALDRVTLAEARAAAGAAPLMADANQTFTAATFAAIRPDLVAAGLGWMEEPFAVDDVAAYAAWPADAPPLAFGENERGLDGIEKVIRLGAAVVQPDITKTGGISGGLAMGRAVVAAGRRLCFHMYGGALGLLASAHLAAAIDGSDWVEMDGVPNPTYEDLLDAPLAVAGGRLALPPGPGLGVTLREDAIARFRV